VRLALAHPALIALQTTRGVVPYAPAFLAQTPGQNGPPEIRSAAQARALGDHQNPSDGNHELQTETSGSEEAQQEIQSSHQQVATSGPTPYLELQKVAQVATRIQTQAKREKARAAQQQVECWWNLGHPEPDAGHLGKDQPAPQEKVCFRSCHHRDPTFYEIPLLTEGVLFGARPGILVRG
jgi:hypothetical protein